MAVKTIYKNHIFFLSNKSQNELDSIKYQRVVNNSKKLRPNLDDFKFSRNWGLEENEDKE